MDPEHVAYYMAWKLVRRTGWTWDYVMGLDYELVQVLLSFIDADQKAGAKHD
jgi:hypothetical protein